MFRDKLLAVVIGLILTPVSMMIGFAIMTYVLPHTPGVGGVLLRPLCALLWAFLWSTVLGAATFETNCGGAPGIQLHTRGVLVFISAFFLVMAGAYPGFAPTLGALWWPLVIIAFGFFAYGFTQERRSAVAG